MSSSAASAPEGQLRQRAPAAKKQASGQKTISGPSSSTMMKLFSDENQGFKVDPMVVLFLAVGFIFSVIFLHIASKVAGKLFS